MIYSITLPGVGDLQFYVITLPGVGELQYYIITLLGVGELQYYIITLPGVGEEVGEGEFFVLQVHHGDQEALDEVPGLPPCKVVRGATLQGGQGKVHRLYRENKASWEIPKPRHHG